MKRFLWVFLFLHVAAIAGAADKYVSPSGSGSTCSLASPGPLAGALSSNACSVSAGDTLWLRAGTYSGTFTSNLAGTSSNPIKVRNYNGERATLDGGTSSAPVLSVGGNYAWFWGLEIKDTNTKRVTSQSGSWPTDVSLGDGVNTEQGGADHKGLKFINLIIHDVRQGVSWWVEATDSEINGCIIYYVGWDAPDRGHGHGIYTQNKTPSTKTIKDSILFNQFGGNIHVYGSDQAFLDNYTLDGNVAFEGGSIAAGGTNDNFLEGGGVRANNHTLTNNVGYYDTAGDSPTCAFDFGGMSGGGGGCSNSSATNNYMINGTCLASCNPTMTGNTFLSQEITGFTQSQYPSNTYLASRPTTGSKVFVRANQYEPGRGHVTIFNWASAATVAVDLSPILSAGQTFEVRNAQNYYAAPVMTGTYGGGTVNIPAGALAPAAPIGHPAPGATGPKFNVYVVMKTGTGPTPSPTVPGPSPTVTGVPPTATKTPTPIPGTPTKTQTPGPGGQFAYFEAESGLVAMPMAMASDPLASGGVYVSSPTADAGTATFTVASLQGGATHYLWHRVLCSTSSADSLYVALDGENDSTHIDDMCEGVWSASWQWRRVTDRPVGLGVTWARALSGGSHSIRFRGREVGAKLDRLAITTDANWIPTDAPGPTATATVPPAPTTTPTPTKTNPPPTVCVTATATPTP